MEGGHSPGSLLAVAGASEGQPSPGEFPTSLEDASRGRASSTWLVGSRRSGDPDSWGEAVLVIVPQQGLWEQLSRSSLSVLQYGVLRWSGRRRARVGNVGARVPSDTVPGGFVLFAI